MPMSLHPLEDVGDALERVVDRLGQRGVGVTTCGALPGLAHLLGGVLELLDVVLAHDDERHEGLLVCRTDRILLADRRAALLGADVEAILIAHSASPPSCR